VRVFVSSTFRDMHAERDELIKHVFPQLRKLCEERGVTWGEVDLRWGVTDEQKAEGKVLPICLAEINNCRPYFIGLLGERYGWVPDEIPQELIEREPWLAEHSGQSVTELEILHGVLNNPAMADHALFYFRDPSFIDSLPREQQSDFLEIATADETARLGQEEAERTAEDRRKKLAALKDRVIKSTANRLRVEENYPDPQSLGEMVLRDLTDIIERLYPADERLDPVERDALDHEAFAQSRTRVYIARKEYFDRLDEHAQGNGLPLAVLGESGSGKSALLANWALRYRNSHSGESLLTHFIGATAYSADWAAMLRRIMSEFKRRFDIGEEIPDQPDALRAAFADWLNMAAAKGRTVLILDALNQLEDRASATDLAWLPQVIPPNIRLIVSTSAGRSLDDLNKRGWPTLRIRPLEAQERKQLIEEYLAQYTKALSPPRVDRIAGADQTANPLYLRALLDELRVYGDHFSLDQRIEHYLTATTIAELYEKVLERYTQDYERERAGLVRDAMSLLWAARRGLSEAELMDLLGAEEEPLPRAFWSPLYLAAESSFITRSGVIAFSNEYLRQAVQNRYLLAEEDQRAAHLKLAFYFGRRELGPRKVEELPWQLLILGYWERLAGLLGDIAFFAAAWAADHLEAKAYWHQIEANSPFRFTDAYGDVMETPEKYDAYRWLYPLLVGEVARRRTSLPFDMDPDPLHAMAARFGEDFLQHVRPKGDFGRLMEFIARGDGDPQQLMNEVEELSELSRTAGNDVAAQMNLFEKAEQFHRKMGDKAPLANALGGQAKILALHGDLNQAIARFREEEQIYRELHDDAGLSLNLGNQARVLERQGELDEAITRLQEQERIAMRLGRLSEIRDSVSAQIRIRAALGDSKSALEAGEALGQIARQTLDQAGLASSLFSQGEQLLSRADAEGALARFHEAEEIYRQLKNPVKLSQALNNQAVILSRTLNRSAEALPLLKEKEQILRRLNNQSELAKTLFVEAVLLVKELGLPDEASPIAEECYRIATDCGLTEVQNRIKSLLREIGSSVDSKSISVAAPTPHPAADPERAFRLNVQYQQEAARWKALPWWKRLTAKKPEPPTGI
jgi:hypothetical protein